MTEYIYREFKISYSIIEELENKLYKADGAVYYLLAKPKSLIPVHFHTEYETRSGAEHEIKKLLENYVDFELKNFHEMTLEKTKSYKKQWYREEDSNLHGVTPTST